MGLVNGLKKIAGFKKQVDVFVDGAKTFLHLLDKLDDDTDGDGKPQVVNIINKVELFEGKVVGYARSGYGLLKHFVTEVAVPFGKDFFQKSKDAYLDCSKDLKVIAADVQSLRQHVMEK